MGKKQSYHFPADELLICSRTVVELVETSFGCIRCHNKRTWTAIIGLSLGFPINVKPSRLTFRRGGTLSEPTMAQTTKRVTARSLTSSRTLCHCSLKRKTRGLKTAVCLPVSSAVKVNSRDLDSPLSLMASCSLPVTSLHLPDIPIFIDGAAAHAQHGHKGKLVRQSQGIRWSETRD